MSEAETLETVVSRFIGAKMSTPHISPTIFSVAEVDELNQFAIRAAFATAVIAAAPVAGIAAHESALSKVAADLGFDYSYLGPEDAVALTAKGAKSAGSNGSAMSEGEGFLGVARNA